MGGAQRAVLAIWPLAPGTLPTLALVDRLARFQLEARRCGCAIQVRGACPALAGLITLVGLDEELLS